MTAAHERLDVRSGYHAAKILPVGLRGTKNVWCLSSLKQRNGGHVGVQNYPSGIELYFYVNLFFFSFFFFFVLFCFVLLIDHVSENTLLKIISSQLPVIMISYF